MGFDATLGSMGNLLLSAPEYQGRLGRRRMHPSLVMGEDERASASGKAHRRGPHRKFLSQRGCEVEAGMVQCISPQGEPPSTLGE